MKEDVLSSVRRIKPMKKCVPRLDLVSSLPLNEITWDLVTQVYGDNRSHVQN